MKTKFIAPRSLGSQGDISWQRKNYTIEHQVGGSFEEGDGDSLYRGTFFDYPFEIDVLGVDGDWSVYETSSPDLLTLVDQLRFTKAEDLREEDEDYENNMPLDMREELAVALLNHHNAQYRRWQEEEGEIY